jgi:hypothetical protein
MDILSLSEIVAELSLRDCLPTLSLGRSCRQSSAGNQKLSSNDIKDDDDMTDDEIEANDNLRFEFTPALRSICEIAKMEDHEKWNQI